MAQAGSDRRTGGRRERVFDAAGATLYVGFGQPDARTAVLTGKHGVTLSLT